MKEYIKEHRIGVSVAVFLLVVLPAMVFAAYYLTESINKNSQEIYSMKIDREVNKSFLENIGQLQENEEIINTKGDKLSLLLKDTTESKVALFGEIKSIAEKSGNTSVRYEVVDEKVLNNRQSERDNFTKIEPYSPDNILLNLSMNGTHSDFMIFLNRIENFAYLSDVLNVSLVESEKRQGVSQRLVRASGGPIVEQEEKDNRQNLLEITMTIAIYLESLLDNAQVSGNSSEEMKVQEGDEELFEELNSELPEGEQTEN